MPISSRLVINLTVVLLTVGLLALAGIISTTVWLGEKAQVYAEDATSAQNTRIAAVELRAAMQVAESRQRGYLVSSNEIYLAPYDSAKAQVGAQLARLESALQPFPATARLLDRLTRLVTDKIVNMDQTIAAKREFRESDALATFDLPTFTSTERRRSSQNADALNLPPSRTDACSTDCRPLKL